ncbi:MAG TPA: hypothetical protein VMT43_13290 [Acidimicrobiales bacterium]|nr:hypothetical protein [Acidimicrobiales bacterium]
MRKPFTAVVLVVGMALGSVLTMVLNPVGAASALLSTATTKGAHVSVLQQALDTLVGKGTITQAQADAVNGQVQSDRAARLAKRPRLGARVFEEIAGALKMNPKALRQELAKGRSIAVVAEEHGVNPSTLAAQIVAGLDKLINTRVAGHHLKHEYASVMEQNLPARVHTLLYRTWGRHHTSTSTPNASTTTTTN